MITLRVNPYNADELAELNRILKEMENIILKKCPSPTTMNCGECKYRHLCYDIFAAQAHAETLAQEALTK